MLIAEKVLLAVCKTKQKYKQEFSRLLCWGGWCYHVDSGRKRPRLPSLRTGCQVREAPLLCIASEGACKQLTGCQVVG